MILFKIKLMASKNVVNKGTGAGGSNTNKNGLPYEELTDLSNKLNVISENKISKLIQFNNNTESVFITGKKSKLFEILKDFYNNSIEKAHGCKHPDEFYIDEKRKNIFILEKKFQQSSGSVCEKIQTGPFKKRHYNKLFPEFKVEYIYCLSEWYKDNCKSEIEDLIEQNIPVYWGNSETYKDDIINFMINYK